MKQLSFLLFFFLPLFSYAQITLDASDIPNAGDVLTTVNCDVPVNFDIGNAGANQTYDLSSMIPTDTTSNSFIAPSGTPGSSEYPNATLASEVDGSFVYYQETSTELFLLGLYTDTSSNNSGQYLSTKFSPANKVFEIPTTYNTSFTDMSSISFTQEDNSGFGDSIRVTNTFNDDILFDGYGTVITPSGSVDGLRERSIQMSTTTIEILNFGIWTTINTTTTIDTSYNWYGNNDIGLASASISDGQVTSASFSIQNIVVITPVADFSSSSNGNTVTFTENSTNSPTSWMWNFGDGNTSTQQNPTHTYAANGTYTVCLTASNSAGSNTTCSTITVSNASTPVADFSSTSNGGTVMFTDNSTNSPTSWMWDFGDGNTSTQQNPTHTYAANGTYTVCLTASNSAGSNTTCSKITISNASNPVADFSSTSNGGTVMFTDNSTNSPTSWLWDFGDGNTSTQQNPTHTYAATGTYTVCLTATNSAGSNTTCSMVTVTITNIPGAAFSFTGETTGTVDFTDNSTNLPTSWLWDFGDGNTNTMQNPQHIYASFGTYNVCLTATNSAGSNTVCQDVAVTVAPVAAFTFVTQSAGLVDFTDASNNNPTDWAWDFGDGNTSIDQNPQHTYSASGMYTVCLTVTNSAGSNTICETVNVVISSTEDLDKIVKVELFPNPVHETLNIRLENDQTKTLNFQLIDALGRRVREIQVNTNGLFELNVENLNVGLYHYIFVDQDGYVRNKGSLMKN
jgi:PKD repeat protein